VVNEVGNCDDLGKSLPLGEFCANGRYGRESREKSMMLGVRETLK